MMKAILKNVFGMEEIVAVMMLPQIIVQHVNALILILIHALVSVDFLTIKVMTIVMMKIIIVDVIGMEEIVVEVMLSQTTVMTASAMILIMTQLKIESSMNQFLVTEERKVIEKIVSQNTQGTKAKKKGCQD